MVGRPSTGDPPRERAWDVKLVASLDFQASWLKSCKFRSGFMVEILALSSCLSPAEPKIFLNGMS